MPFIFNFSNICGLTSYDFCRNQDTSVQAYLFLYFLYAGLDSSRKWYHAQYDGRLKMEMKVMQGVTLDRK